MKTIEEIATMIEEEDIEFIRLQFTDILGNLKNVAVTPGQLERVYGNRYSFNGNAMFDNAYEYPDNLYLHPDWDTFVVLPWRPQQGKVAKVVCDVYTEDGTPFSMSPRQILKNVLEKAREKGYTFFVDPECEFFLFHTDENGLPTTISHEKAGYLDVGPTDFGENARRDIVLMLEEMGFDIESSHHENAPAQHEIDFKQQEAMAAADAVQTFRFAVRSIAKRFGLYATFMPKPKTGIAGSGMHTNFMLFRDGENVFRNADGNPSEEAYSFIGGILSHASALIAIANPTINSYKRLMSGYDAPSRINWSRRGEKSFVKMKHTERHTKLELRFPDGASNPYLLIAACVAAGLDGMEKQIMCGPDSYGLPEDQFPILPGSLTDAVNSLEKDEVLNKALGHDLVKVYATIKDNEWRDYMTCVSEWEINRYLSRI